MYANLAHVYTLYICICCIHISQMTRNECSKNSTEQQLYYMCKQSVMRTRVSLNSHSCLRQKLLNGKYAHAKVCWMVN